MRIRVRVLFSFVALTFFLSSAQRLEPAEAAPAGQAEFVAIPAAAYVTLEVMALASTAALAAGIISLQQDRAYKARIGELAERLRAATGDAIDAVGAQIKQLYKNIAQATKKKVGPITKPTNPAKDADCKNGTNDDPRKCCSDWLKQAENVENADRQGFFMVPMGERSFSVYGPNGKFKCCLEWDGTHARFEVYTSGGDGRYPKEPGDAYTHHGETSCKDREVRDPCRSTHPDKADNSGPHAPRSGCKSSMSHQTGSGTQTPSRLVQ